ncbi:DNA primase [Helicobacter sp. WB40]|uniref:DNA primase n=1 Tax=Helicobacter sp. WB40 TaxID=3004130 RepID=UPI0022EBD60F|nr:DNA primase [Helicobacter sp. WB40]MDA3966639.1 DNA primase [Helicobacter sp. WB40]
MVEIIKSKADIVEIISDFLPLKRSGANFVCACPFHSERSASFTISPKMQIYHCFGCGESGDVIKFIEKYKHITFKEAIEFLANKLGVELKSSSNNKVFFNALEKLNALFLESLIDERIIKYLQKRGLELEDFKTYNIGFVPKINLNAFSVEEIKALHTLGAVYNYKDFKYFSLNNRISFGICNSSGKIVGFSGRTHPFYNFKDQGKYINSKNSHIFNKSEILYNLHLAKDSIIKSGEAYVLEGFFDCIALSKMGFSNCVATCGTAFCLSHLSLLLKLRGEVKIIFCFDNDSAGEAANLRALEVCFKASVFDCFVATLENNTKDIGEVLQKREELKLKKEDGFRYFLKKLDKQVALKNATEIIKAQNNYFLKERLINVTKEVLGIRESIFYNTKQVLVSRKDNNARFIKTLSQEESYINNAVNYLSGEELGEWESDYKELLLGKKTKRVLELELDSKIIPFSYEELNKMIKQIYLKHLRTQAQYARNKNDIKKLVELNEKIAYFNR